MQGTKPEKIDLCYEAGTKWPWNISTRPRVHIRNNIETYHTSIFYPLEQTYI